MSPAFQDPHATPAHSTDHALATIVTLLAETAVEEWLAEDEEEVEQ